MTVCELMKKLEKIADDLGDLEVVICVKKVSIRTNEILALVETVTVDTDCDKIEIGGDRL